MLESIDRLSTVPLPTSSVTARRSSRLRRCKALFLCAACPLSRPRISPKTATGWNLTFNVAATLSPSEQLQYLYARVLEPLD